MIYIHDFSLCCALGQNTEQTLRNFLENQAPGLRESADWLVGGVRAFFGHCVAELQDMAERHSKHDSRNNRLLLHTYKQRESEFQALLSKYDKERVGVFLGTTTSGSDEADQYIGDRFSQRETNFTGYCQELGDPARFLAKYLDIKGPSYSICTACTSSTRAFISAAKLIEAGVIDAAFVGGVDTLARMPINGFNALEALSHEVCRPFASDRKGITIGEGAGLFFVSKDRSDIALLGYGETSDGFHMTAPRKDGELAAKAMTDALERAKLSPDHIAYLNLHGTGTELNDASETAAVKRVFKNKVNCTSTKNLTGHTLGAAGAVESGLLCALLRADKEHRLPGQGLSEDKYDKEVLEMGLRTESFSVVPGAMMTNNFAFGGNNATLIFGKPNE